MKSFPAFGTETTGRCDVFRNRQPLRTKQGRYRGPFGVKPKSFVRKSFYLKNKNLLLGGEKLQNAINRK